jgi:hypothetical protein
LRDFISQLWAEFSSTDSRTQAFVRFLRRERGKNQQKSTLSPRIALVQINKIPSSHAGVSLVLPEFCNHAGARPVAFYPDFQHGNLRSNVIDGLRTIIRTAFLASAESIYFALGVRQTIRPRRSARLELEVQKDLELLRKSVKTKRDLEALQLRGIWIGDLVYDQALVEFSEVTVELEDSRLWDVLRRAIELVVFFEGVFSKYSVVGVFGFNAYLGAIPSRIAMSKNIPVFQADTHLERLRVPMADGNFTRDFPSEFLKTGLTLESPEVKRAADYVLDFVHGRPVKPIFGHSFKSFQPQSDLLPRVLLPSDRFKVLIAPHNPFSDSPHAVGRGLFPDYGEWLEFVGDISKSTDFEWYLKMHPDQRDPQIYKRNLQWLQDFCQRFEHIILLPEKVSHDQLIREGIGGVLTVHGSIGFEYSLRGIPVVNASVDNPHRPFGFTLSPETIEQLSDAIQNLPAHAGVASPSIEPIIKYCYMWLFHVFKGPLFPDLHLVHRKLGAHLFWDTPEIYVLLMQEWGSIRNLAVRKSLAGYFDSGDRLWLERHIASA